MASKITGGARKPSTGRGGNGRPLAPTDNLTPEEKSARAAQERREREEAEAIQLMSVVSTLRPKLAKVKEIADQLKAAKDLVNDHFRAAKLQSKDFERGRIMELIEDTSPDARRDVTRNEAIRARFRRLMGLPVGDASQEELDLEARLPDVERDGGYWHSVGYTDGVTAAPRKPPIECIQQGHGNRYDGGYDAGKTILEVNLEKGKKAKAAPVPPKPEETSDQRKAREAKEAATAKAALENLGKDKPLPTDAKAVGQQAAADFEADQAELAAQTTRQAVVAAREGEIVDEDPLGVGAEAQGQAGDEVTV